MQLLVANQQFAETREPRVGDFDHPAPRTLALSALRALLAARPHVGGVVTVEHVLLGGGSDEAGIRAQMLSRARRHGRTWSDDGVQGRRQLGNIVAISRGHDDRQLGATDVVTTYLSTPILLHVLLGT